MKPLILALLFLIASPATAQNFWIPAERFDEYTDLAIEGSLALDEVTGKPVYLLGPDQQVRINIQFNDQLKQYLAADGDFRVCVWLANYDSGVTNTIRTRHPNPLNNKTHTLSSNEYQIACSANGSIDENNLLPGGIRVVSQSQGLIKLRGMSIRRAEGALLANYEYSRALGYLWGDGGIASDGSSLYFQKRDTDTSNHFYSVAKAAFGSALIDNQHNSRYFLTLNNTDPARFLARGPTLSNIPDRRAFLTSVIESEGAVKVARLVDDKEPSRCNFVRNLVNSLNPQCAVSPCTDSRCATPNCAFIAHGKYRGEPYVPGSNSNCAVYLSGDDSDWRAMFRGYDYHFVKTDRTPGGEPRKYSPGSRPAYTR